MDDIVIDARWLEPPEPLERVLATLARRRRDQRVRLLLHREPYPLYDLLRQMGLAYDTQPSPDGTYVILIHPVDDRVS